MPDQRLVDLALAAPPLFPENPKIAARLRVLALLKKNGAPPEGETPPPFFACTEA
jgi:hypothetical protein